MGHAINAPVGITMFVTYSDGESSIIGSDDLNGFTWITWNWHRFSLTTICCLVPSSIWGFACKNNKISIKMYFMRNIQKGISGIPLMRRFNINIIMTRYVSGLCKCVWDNLNGNEHFYIIDVSSDFIHISFNHCIKLSSE